MEIDIVPGRSNDLYAMAVDGELGRRRDHPTVLRHTDRLARGRHCERNRSSFWRPPRWRVSTRTPFWRLNLSSATTKACGAGGRPTTIYAKSVFGHTGSVALSGGP